MMKYFLVSSLILLFTGCVTAARVAQSADVSPANTPLWTEELRDDINLNRYQVDIQVKGNHITGICMLRKSDEGWRGTLLNEFSVRAFDFIVTPKKCELLHTISMLNKWYIRRTIADDLHFLFEIDNPDVSFQQKIVRYTQADDSLVVTHYPKKKFVRRMPDNKLIMNNLKRKIVYSLTVIPE